MIGLAPISPLLGRSRELALARRALERGRLLTLTGPGGVGKSRLAVELAVGARTKVAVVELAAVGDPTSLLTVIGSSLRLRDDSGRPPAEVLAEHLAGFDGILILDNCEHLLRPVARLVAKLLSATRDLRILVTSQEPLGVAGETVQLVAPLPLPDPRRPLELDAMTRYPALQLFGDRARARGGFVESLDDLEAVAELCHRLDGLPLAIELAAARIAMMPVRQLLDRLQDRFAVLGPGTDPTGRHRTLRAAIDWSFRLLEPAEQAVLLRLSIFADGFSIEAAEAVAASPSLPAAELLGVLGRLVERSLVTAGPGTGAGARYRLLESIRAFAAELLDLSGERPAVEARHCEYFTSPAFASLQRRELSGRVSPPRAATEDAGNLRQARFWALTHDPGRALAASQSLAVSQRGEAYLGIGRGLLREALAQAPADSPGRVAALTMDAWLAHRQGEYREAEESALRAVEIAERLGDQPSLVQALARAGDVARHDGAHRLAMDRLERALELAEATGDEHWQGRVLSLLGHSRGMSGDLPGARRDFARALQLLGDRASGQVAYARMWMAEVELAALDLAAAGRALDRALLLIPAVDDEWPDAYCLDLAAWLAAEKRQPLRSLRLGAAAAALRASVGSVSPPAHRRLVEAALEAARQAAGHRAAQARDDGGRLNRAQAYAYARTDAWPPPVELVTASPTAAGLTGREREIAQLVAGGLTDKEIAGRLGVAPRTAEWHLQRLRVKLGLRSRSELAAWAVRHGLAVHTR